MRAGSIEATGGNDAGCEKTRLNGCQIFQRFLGFLLKENDSKGGMTMSIMETIEAAEQQAEQLRREARIEAREKLQAAQAQGRAQADRRIAQAKETAKQIINDAQELARRQVEQELAQQEERQRQLLQDRAKLPDAVRTIVEEALR